MFTREVYIPLVTPIRIEMMVPEIRTIFSNLEIGIERTFIDILFF